MSARIPSDFDFSAYEFGPVIELPESYEIYDFSKGYDAERARSSVYGIGRYNERRPGMYNTQLFVGGEAPRDIHVGIDIAAPAGTPVRSFYDGEIYMTGINSADGDYGGTIITVHRLGEKMLYALYGHLSHASATALKPGDKVRLGDVIAALGEKHENGGWNPHLHFQLSWARPGRCDLPGAVNEKDLEAALRTYPDPRLVLGPLY